MNRREWIGRNVAALLSSRFVLGAGAEGVALRSVTVDGKLLAEPRSLAI